MTLDLLPTALFERYHVEERRGAVAILSADCKTELQDLVECLDQFKLRRSEIEAGGGGKTKITARFDDFLKRRGWQERIVRVSRTIEIGVKKGKAFQKTEDRTIESETHKVDFVKGSVAVEVEWNNKDPFFDRDLNTFRLLHDLAVISVGVMITRMDQLQALFDTLYDKDGNCCGRKYGASTTHWSKLLPRVDSGRAGNCPLLLVGIKPECYVDDGGLAAQSAGT
jgi:hypothetical protein